jgi:uncharacterized C2H2 Zn-finger protein
MSQTDLDYAQASGCPGFRDGPTPDALYSRDYARIAPYQHDFAGVESSLVNASFLVLDNGVEQTSIASFHLPLNAGSAHHLAAGLSLDVNKENEFHQIGTTPIGPDHGWMQHHLNVPDAQQLADLSEVQLENIAKDDTQALALAKQKRLQGSVKSAKLEGHNKKTEKVDKVGKGSQNKRPLLKCEHPGCNTTFRRNKDRTRHVRNKHQENPGFTCPIVDCLMGAGHALQRADKLRDHLRGKSAFSRTWRCVIPGCSETGGNRSWWFDHVAFHDFQMRFASMNLLTSYGYNEFYQGYFMSNHLCIRRGCPFGTKSSAAMEEHRLVPHEGPHCSCPITECKIVCKNWAEVKQHLGECHTKAARDAVRNVLHDQGFGYILKAFTCPILACRQVVWQHYSWDFVMDVRKHCMEHEFATLLSAAEPLVNAWRLCFEGYYVVTRLFKFDLYSATRSSSRIFAYLAFPEAELLEAKTNHDLDRLCLEKGINLP